MTRAPAPAAESPRHRVAIVGAGFGGLFAARAPRRAQLGDPAGIGRRRAGE